MGKEKKYAIGGIALGALGALGGAIDYFGANSQLSGAEQDVQSAESNMAGSLKDLAAERYKKSQDQSNLEAMMTGFRPLDLTPLQTIQAQSLEALATGGERALMTGATNLARQSFNSQMGAQDQAFNRELSGRQMAAESTAQMDAANASAKQQAAMLEAQMNQQALMQAQQNLGQIEAAKASAIPNALGSIISIPGIFGEAEEGGRVDEISKYNLGGVYGGMPMGQPNRRNRPLMDSLLGSIGSRAGDALMDKILKNNQPPAAPPIPTDVDPIDKMEMGGKPIVQKLEGPEDHDKKKYAIMDDGAVVDEDNGEKVAEATGQEYILNSEQAKGIHDEYDVIAAKIKSGEKISDEEWMVFYKAVDGVFSLPQFNEETA